MKRVKDMRYSRAIRRVAHLAAIPCAFLLASCQTHVDLPRGPAAYETLTSSVEQTEGVYHLSPGDVISIRVLRIPELSFDEITLDTAGSFNYPLLGQIKADGMTQAELSEELRARLAVRYLERPDVTVQVKELAGNMVTVLGAVTEPGKFKLTGRATLLDAIAQARGFTRIAHKEQVVILRTINGKQMGALFDVGKIQRNETEDPRIYGNDKVVVGINHLESAWRDALLAAPLIAVFQPLYN